MSRIPKQLTSESKERAQNGQRNDTARLDYVDGLRGIAVLMVVVFHAAVWGGLPTEGGRAHFWQVAGGPLPLELGFLRHFLSVGGAGVDLFLVVSGFCLFLPLVRGEGGKVRALDVRRFAVRRVRRIVPPYYAALALIVLVSWLTYSFEGESWWPWRPNSFQNVFPWQGADSWKNLAAHLALLHGLFGSYISAWEGALWSLSLEWQFYFLFVPLAWIAKRGGVWAALATPIIATLAFRGACAAWAPDFLNTAVGYNFSLSRWAEFGTGMIAAALVCGALPDVLTRRLATLRALAPLLVVALVAAAWRTEFFDTGSPLRMWLWGSAGAAVLIGASALPVLRRALEWRPLVRLGTISYSLYLTHGAFYMALALGLSRTGLSRDLRQMLYLLAGPMGAVAFAALFFWAFERPFLSVATRKSGQGDEASPIQEHAAP